MARSDFSKFVEREAAEAASEPINLEAEKSFWLNKLNELYSSIRSYLSEFVDRGQVEIAEGNAVISEELLGAYQVPIMTIKIGRQTIQLKPIGTFLIGTRGRVDLTGAKGTVRLILADKDSTAPKLTVTRVDPNKPAQSKAPPRQVDWTWKIVASQAPIRYFPLEQDNFTDALLEVANA